MVNVRELEKSRARKLEKRRMNPAFSMNPELLEFSISRFLEF
jgi:hypothetical protein